MAPKVEIGWLLPWKFSTKPTDHKMMMEWMNEQRILGEVKTKAVIEKKGYQHKYEWINEVPLNGNKNTITVNFFNYKMISVNEEGEEKIAYQNSWVTDFYVSDMNVINLTRAGRCRWRIENECFNTLKNQGYYIEHNYGHGKSHLISELTNELYQAIRKKLGSKRYLLRNYSGVYQDLYI